ncbi:TauD/TfdA family dioxygenase [Branchiibius sp. NY16-3462-2]|uniref:TauD/TfdA dioxygenase family protein n=1 Tax=Branchiibius sp. NY16-3462-2 TaxID=1807500 RepID=UPI00079A9007|nr:TauD/TfdA family dioxygenase [Branchiibius sp. NY16-3462-2]KYH43524.1 taurine catabolism dioxygenase [Branchiibius sp. NY16-3462-2]
MRIAMLRPVGVELTDLDLRDVDAATLAGLPALLADHGVVVFRDQPLDDTGFLRFLRSFGELMFTAGETPVPGFPDLKVISNVGRTSPPRSVFHVDTSYVSQPPAYTALRTVVVPSRGGETLFTNQYRAYETLPPEVTAALEGRSITHRVTGVTGLGPEQETEAEHPVFRVHPVSGRTSLYLSTPARCVAISGMDQEESARTVQYLFDHSTAPANILRHGWRPGDVVMWDNGCVLHKADHSGVDGDRVMHRGMVARYAA